MAHAHQHGVGVATSPDGTAQTSVAGVAAELVALIALFLAHDLNLATAAALLSSIASL